ncbi:hypothetical protein [Mycobacterium sp.]|uniref:DUF7159 family protein n=1 Tax=Mycobacterium sp. TaxID=1785 RepID=UPI0031DE4C90
MEIVLGVSMAPTSVRMLLVEGETADGATVEDATFGIATDRDASTLSAADQVISAILGTREGAAEAGHALTSTGVTWTDPVDAAALRDALVTRKIENVMLVSSFMAAAALAQVVGCTVGDAHTALLFLEPDTATLAVINAADGSITDVHKELMPDGHAVAELAGMVAGLAELETQPRSVFIVGAGVDVATIKSQLEAVTTLPVTAAENPDTALAWGAALASANAPLFASSTAALAYALDPGTGAIDPHAVSPGYLAAPDVPLGTALGEDDLAYSAVPDEEADAHTAVQEVSTGEDLDGQHQRGPLVLIGSILAVLFVAAALSLEVALALGIQPSVALLPLPLQHLIIQSPAPASPPARASAPAPEINHLIAPAVVPAPAHAAIAAPPRAVPVPALAAPPIPAVPPPIPAAPLVPVQAPLMVPLPIPVPAPAPARIPVHAPILPPVQILPHAPILPPAQILPPAPMPPPVQVPGPVQSPPAHRPAPTPPVQMPPPVQVPGPVQSPPAHRPAPTPPVQMPEPQHPIPVGSPRPPVQFPMPEPGHPPIPQGPLIPGLPGLGIPGLTVPVGPPQGPSFNPPDRAPGGFGGGPGAFGGGPGGFGGHPGFGGGFGGFGGHPGFGGGFGGFGGHPAFGGFGGFRGFGGGHR